MVVVGPWVVQVEVRVAVFDGAGVGFGCVAGVDLGAEAALVAAVVAVVAVAGLGWRLAGDAAADGVPVAAVVADEAATGGGCDPCTRTLPDPLLHAVAASITQSPAATVPGVRISA